MKKGRVLGVPLVDQGLGGVETDVPELSFSVLTSRAFAFFASLQVRFCYQTIKSFSAYA